MKNKCAENAEQHCKSYPNCYGCNAYRNPTIYDKIRHMSIDEMAEFFAGRSFPSSACYICEYDDGFNCKYTDCTDEYEAEVYKHWLEKEVVLEERDAEPKE